MRNVLLLAAALGLAAGAQAQTKNELVQKVLQLQQPGIENLARGLAERPAAQMMQQAGMVLQSRVPADKREAVARDIQAELKKYADEAVPLARERALKLAPATVGALLEEKFSEDELKQLIALLESPVNRKFQQLGPEMERALAQKLTTELGPTIDPKLKALQQSVGKLLGEPAAASAPKK